MHHSKLPPGYMPPGQNTVSYLLRKSKSFHHLGTTQSGFRYLTGAAEDVED